MAKEVLVKVWCDSCRNQEGRTGETTSPIALNGQPAKTLDLCEVCSKTLIEPLAQLLAEQGVEVDLPAPKKSKRTTVSVTGLRAPEVLSAASARQGREPANGRLNDCLWCDLSYSGDGGGFGRHLRVVHGFDGFREAFGGMCPICGDGQFDLMLSHAKKSHPEFGFVGVAQPFMWARDNGDPHGVYAEKLKQVGSLDPQETWQATRERERKLKSNADEKTA